MKEIEDIYNTHEFKELPWKNRVWFRIKVAFFATIGMM
jgi:hypothetical protein